MPVLRSHIDTSAEWFTQNCDDMREQLAELDELQQQAAAGGGPRAMARMRSRDKMPVRERIAMVLDRDSPFFEISSLAGYCSNYAVGGGLVMGIGVVNGVECMIEGNDPTVLGGAITVFAGRKIMRAIEICRDNRMPYIQFVESAGGDLRGDDDPERQMLEQESHFAESGRLFYDVTELSKMKIPSISVVFGSSTAGGAYQPGMSDYNIFIRNQSKVFLGGPPLVKMATGEDSDDETLGGAQMHAEISGLADYLAEDEADALRICREVVAHLNWRKLGPGPTMPADPPVHDPEELLGLMPRDLQAMIDCREVIARITDGSRFEEFKARYGTTLICGWASVHGFPVGILGNNGPLFSDSSEKATQFIQLCNQQDIPLVFLQNITGYMVGKDFEQGGIVKNGSKMINAVSNSMVPHITVILGNSYGAGNYGMSGRAFNTRFTYLWPTAKIAIMGPKQIAGVMSIVRRGQAMRRGIEFDEEADRKITEQVEHYHELKSLAPYASGRVTDDGVIDPRDTRDVIAMSLSACHTNVVKGADGFGVFRM
ncbi:MAG: acyl-CoA carboxylase subunit beta [Acidimicrobiales bacterium]|uniref:acyl-CoA carboxylase subunit beta n=1 Tax=Candidatus Poriferisodalis multihospitum TaxID=2983191 RepID=UPI00137E9031|nr:carboxyl transferase domain-containing protein [Candidatus Poriferisodalis multihospitum]MCY3609514.1 acyl-CoA carboxylase subunit beta [Acidimicrobiaceae bacterium]MXV87564.1 acyl-CoA carboxylase subunit beta [Acidimicrobiales bacterium]MXY02091.1 acyl-CoA carboxylase subunit beta [Acidimicrobiales bacterium]MYB82467.1 acyl-CoA carboxylase subunit beta [Acidimicrobiales bacterium]MYG87127.1 acyl-CoA carboxylase subunit beta [Acidimicrobiales bacterium]